jgi:hypothetical protein
MNQELRDHRRKHEITREHLRAGALRGEILDADGSTILNIFTEFGVTETVFDFKFGTATTDMRIVSMGVKRHMERHLMGDSMKGVRALCSQTFFEKIVGMESVKRAWDNWQSQSNNLGIDPRSGFYFGGVTYEEYVGEGSVLNEDGTTTVRAFIPDGDARFFPEGTHESFATWNAPSDFMEDVGMEGEPYYAKQEAGKMNRCVDIHSQQNPLPLCMRPALLVRGHSSN